MKFSILTVALNAGAKLAETVNSVQRQSFGDWELIIKDGMSTDGSVDSILKDERIKVIKQSDKSIYDAMNQAVKVAEGEYILFMNCGDFFYNEDVLKDVNKAITENPDRGIYYGNAFFRQVGDILTMPQNITPFTCYRHIPNHQACIFARTLFEQDEFNLDYKIRADYDFFLRQYFAKDIRPMHTGITIADYEGGGYSETKENRKRDKEEHLHIVRHYMKPQQVAWYRFIMVITLQPLRKYIAQKSSASGLYDKIKRTIVR